ncbi:hypothetical protein ACFZBU_38710 [Embleya sp. NPDC008237]|uniref:hypothetical protein n=1 Tax=Embleya sp. NPDC008237 TaxID=3363978 RepID=UPI0036E6CE08
MSSWAGVGAESMGRARALSVSGVAQSAGGGAGGIRSGNAQRGQVAVVVAGQFPGGLGRGQGVQALCVGRGGRGGEAVVAELFGGFGLGPQAAGAGGSGSAQCGALFVGGLVGEVGGAGLGWCRSRVVCVG